MKAAKSTAQVTTHSAFWLYGGQFHCYTHRSGIPFFFAPEDAVCAECSENAPESYFVPKERA